MQKLYLLLSYYEAVWKLMLDVHNGYKFKHGKIETNWTCSCTISLVHLDTQDFFSFTMNVFHFPFSFLVHILMFCFTWLYYFHIYYCQQNLLNIFKIQKECCRKPVQKSERCHNCKDLQQSVDVFCGFLFRISICIYYLHHILCWTFTGNLLHILQNVE